uniref:Uncharacterized protein n=1 Tax=Gossypium raimondii TaxID=29730 RepID=A0A0D2R9D3_GOSRA|nr:hypothetical protein B456_004G234500 [Gossypium raimondii]
MSFRHDAFTYAMFLTMSQNMYLANFSENKNERVVCVKNMTPEDILLYATRLRNALGRKVVKLKTRHVTKHLVCKVHGQLM